MTKRVLAFALGLTSLSLIGCVRVEAIHVSYPEAPINLSEAFRDGADLTCVHEPSPGLFFDNLGYVSLLSSIKSSAVNSRLREFCPRFQGLNISGMVVGSYETVVVRLKDCRVIAVRSLVGSDKAVIDGVPNNFCTRPQNLAAIKAPWESRQTILIDTQRAPDDVGRTPY